MMALPRRLRVQGLCLVVILSIVLILSLSSTSSVQRSVRYSTHGYINETTSSSKYAIATLLSGTSGKSSEGSGADDDYYYMGTRVLTYQLLHAPETRCRRQVPFLVLVTATVSQQKRQQLTRDGAKVVPVEDVPLRWWIKTGVTRWRDVFAKLRLFQMVEYDRILFLDGDTLLTGPVDGIFDDPLVRIPRKTLLDRTAQVKADESPLPARYMFAARSDNALTGKRDHGFPPAPTDVFSAGFWVMAPDQEMFAYFSSVMDHYRRFDPHTMEQSLLNYAYRRAGPMPWAELHYRWSATWPNSKDLYGRVVALHEKLWGTGPEDLRIIWWNYKRRMEMYYNEHTPMQ